MRVDQHSSPSEDISKSASPILVYGGAICESSPSEAQVDYAQGKGLFLIGFLFYRFHGVS